MLALVMKIRRYVDSSNLSHTQKENLISFAIAQAIAYGLPLPSSPVNSISAHYNNNFAIEVSRRVSAFNEHMVVRVADILEIINKVYRYRYSLVYNPTEGDALNIISFMMSVENNYIPPFLKELESGYKDTTRLLTGLIISCREEWSGVEDKAVGV